MNNFLFFTLFSCAHQSVLLDTVIIFVANTLPYLVILAAGVFLLAHHDIVRSKNPFASLVKKWKEIVGVFMTSACAWIAATVLKHIFHTPRPFVAFSDIHSLFSETGFAFPSGHATFFMALGVSIFYAHKRVGYVFIACAILIGIARIMAGVHFPIDIVGGFSLGFLVAFFVKSL